MNSSDNSTITLDKTPSSIGTEHKAFDPQLDASQRTWRFGFKGDGMEYFKIWITNLFLTIITLTLYAPWAKVRRLRYFYGNTYVNRRKFDFTGVPVRILYGRLLALALYGLFYWISNLSLTAYAVTFVGMVIVLPWIIRSSHRFMARNSKFENGRFYFSATMGQTYTTFICCVLVYIFSLGLLFPLALYWFKRYQINHLYVGQLGFKFKADAGAFFAAIFVPALIFLVLIVIALSAMVLSFSAGNVGTGSMVIPGLLYLVGVFYIGPFIQGRLFKVTWDNVEIGRSILKSDVDAWKFAWIQATNTLAIIFSFGLLFAWAKVRIYRYKVESLSLTFYDDPNELTNLAQSDHSALGEEISDIFDIDISI